jgi:DNA adenine methylase/adenine-specific DNA-methyltransferase
MDGYIEDALSDQEAGRGFVLTCQMIPESDCVVTVPASSEVCIRSQQADIHAKLTEINRLSESTLSFTVAGDPERYKDGRRDVRLGLREHFVEHVAAYNACCFDNGRQNRVTRGDVFALEPHDVDLVYMDPPYVPRADDNCYIKRYHFLEGLATYWQDEEILETSRVKKIKKRFTPFSYRKTAVDAFDAMFSKFSGSIQVLSYSSNGYPDLDVLVGLMRKCKPTIDVFERDHRYHFGTHQAATRNQVKEYLIIGC